ncbi:ABC transporter substrate-binding protein [Ktedonosporobacter rubrisoli]|uniref:ABC transporter substrate-binding protein n=1 Tax=Ktedonosporobacter rubrisoli TaxID=2509675 RepID=A0A4P6JHU0_KTERU|nr:zinc ABC transporter substrate-binding protein [Ktedonosporobacter rubrisoli]QBD74605.1 ABC transporter substrate-binding protein [Ktedonosporobacter rubrisoli]
MATQRKPFIWLSFIFIIVFLLSACGSTASGTNTNTASSNQPISVVAAENFYGDIVKQLGGNQVNVTSILSDPNVDPHEYETTPKDAMAVAQAQLVIENGGGYDSWLDKLLSSSPNQNRIVLKAFDIAKVKLPDNEHVWYSLENMQTLATSITASLKKIDAAHANSFESNLQTFSQALQQVQQKMSTIKASYNHTPVGLTETIFLYQAEPMGLNVLTPLEFQKAVAEGNDPPADTVITAENQITRRQIKVLIYNEQTVSPVTTKLQNDAKAQHIPIVAVTETMPAGKTYQAWMLDQLNQLEKSLEK